MLEIPTAAQRAGSARAQTLNHLFWLASAKPDWGIEYHCGHLAVDRGSDPAAHSIGRLFAVAEEIGLVELTQFRIEVNQYSYRARRRNTGSLTLAERHWLESAVFSQEER